MPFLRSWCFGAHYLIARQKQEAPNLHVILRMSDVCRAEPLAFGSIASFPRILARKDAGEYVCLYLQLTAPNALAG